MGLFAWFLCHNSVCALANRAVVFLCYWVVPEGFGNGVVQLLVAESPWGLEICPRMFSYSWAQTKLTVPILQVWKARPKVIQ